MVDDGPGVVINILEKPRPGRGLFRGLLLNRLPINNLAAALRALVLVSKKASF